MHLHIVTEFYPPDTGAAAVRLERLARLIVAEGHCVTVITVMPHYPAGKIDPAYRGELFHRETRDGVTVLRAWLYATPNKSARARILSQLSAAAGAALRGTFAARPDVILLESHPLFMTLAGGWLRRVKRAPVVLNVSDLWPESAVATGALRADSTTVKLAARVERWAYREADAIIGMTSAVVEGILAAGGDPARTRLITNGVDLDRFRPDSGNGAAFRAQFGLSPDVPVAMHIGNMSITYDFEMIATAARALPDVSFVFVGGGSQEPTIHARTADLPNVIFAGTLPHESMPAAWDAADVGLIALGDHGLASGTRPAKLYEAMATGTPVVAAIRGEGADLLRESGAGVATPPGDSAAYIAALRSLIDDPARREAMRALGRAYAEVHFSPQAVKDAYLDVLRKAIE